MEFLLENLTAIFSYFTGILIAWGLFLGYEHFKIISFAKKIYKQPRKEDVMQMYGLIITSLGLLLGLYAFPTIIIRLVDVLFVLEIWYAVYLLCVTTSVYKSLKFIQKVTPKIHSSIMGQPHN